MLAVGAYRYQLHLQWTAMPPKLSHIQ